jgi:hypothetical protein
MELLLNLLWLMLALPALWMWRQSSAQGTPFRLAERLRPLVLLACVLVLLFPVVSATDDLHAMRPEMEESNPSRRVVKQVSIDKSSSGTGNVRLTALLVLQAGFYPGLEACGQVCMTPVQLPETARPSRPDSRGPPTSNLS